MKFRTYCFIVIPIVLLGCGSYHFFNTHKEQFSPSQLPKNDPKFELEAKKLDGRKGK